ncbi:AAA family ATPase [Curtobacterium sp. MCLR17_044]|uniref:AAA family ATPase n=1 Tax=Curtobacterium sp. MCLR17_044 TaxID=2175628 RepID=UPI000DA8A391|nr:AAA family ATPase [Curtobacterium sp. MCLR17_044]PZE56164.1 hypothetical protein DEJ04_13140 [Curtobacterium sp. MCLR17_044]
MTKKPRSAPWVQHVEVDGVRLYEDGGNLGFDVTHPLTAFVGANGIGKSTLLALINFALTGIVVDPAANYLDVPNIATRSASFARSYFSGRVHEIDRDRAEVRVRFELRGQTFLVGRNLFDGALVRQFELHEGDQRLDLQADDDASRTEEYRASCTRAAGLANFGQFIFWQLYVMIFDERRHLLFWNEETLSTALMLSLGVDPAIADKAESLRRDIDKQESLARNARWRATQAERRRRKLMKDARGVESLSDEEQVELVEEYRDAEDAEALLRKRVDASETALDDSKKLVADLAIEESLLESEYLSLLKALPRARRPMEHAILVKLNERHECDLCGNDGVAPAEHVVESIEAHKCPLCDSVLAQGDVDVEPLQDVDRKLNAIRKRLNDSRLAHSRLRAENVQLSELWKTASGNLSRARDQAGPLTSPEELGKFAEAFERVSEEIREALEDVDRYRETRDSFRNQLGPLLRVIADAYREVEEAFVPAFRSLAERFIGREVDIELDAGSTNLSLRFELEGQSRRIATELSESQQYFVDIALRMAIQQVFLEGPSTLMIDTPEGSLDIAYETRAGEMFAETVRLNGHLLMLSNLNGSHLLERLAERLNDSQMEIVPMLNWTNMSDVQLAATDLFDLILDGLQEKLSAESIV